MVEINCNRFREFMKCLDPAGKEFIYDFDETGVSVKAINASNDLLVFIEMDFPTGFNGKLGLSNELIRKILPKGIDTIDVQFGKKSILHGTGYKATLLAINEVSCQREPKKDPEPTPDAYVVNPQVFHDKLKELHEAFDGVGYILEIDPMAQGEITISDSDSSIGSMVSTIPTVTPIEKKLRACLPYDNTLLPLNAIRLISDTVALRWMPLPSNDSCSALVLWGTSAKPPLPEIFFQYVIAPRIETP